MIEDYGNDPYYDEPGGSPFAAWFQAQPHSSRSGGFVTPVDLQGIGDLPSGHWAVYGHGFDNEKSAKQNAGKLFGFYKGIRVKKSVEGSFFILVLEMGAI